MQEQVTNLSRALSEKEWYGAIMKRFLLIISGVLLLAGAGYAVLRNPGDAAESAPKYRVEPATRGAIIASVSATGTVTPTTIVIVGSQLSGQVVEILADYNTPVKAGQVLARLNTDTLKAKRDAARADLAQMVATRRLNEAQGEKAVSEIARAEAQQRDLRAQLQKADVMLADAQTTFERQTSLKERGITSDVTLQSATTQRASQNAARRSVEAQIASSEAQIASLKADARIVEAQKSSSEAQIAKAEAQVRQIEVDLSNSEIRSPVDGVVIQRNIELGATVAASLSAPTLFLVAQDLRVIDVYVNLDEADVGRVKPGNEVEFTVSAHPGRVFRGQVKLVRLGSQNVQNVVIYTTIVSVQNEDLTLLPGMTANLRLFTERKADVLRVPNAALRWVPAGTPRSPAPGAEGAPAPRGDDGEAPGLAPASAGAQRAPSQLIETLTKELALSPKQVAEAQALGTAMRDAITKAGDDPAARREIARKQRTDFTRKLEALLTPEQQEKYRAYRASQPQGVAGRANANAANGVPARLFVLDEQGNPRALTIRIGATDGAFSEVLSGEIKPGDMVITGASSGGKQARQSSAFRFGL